MNEQQKKVGIFTFSYSSNPGSVLQAYALQQTLSEMPGYDCSIINYQKTGADKPIWGRNVFCGSIMGWTPGKVVGWVKRLVAYPMRMRKYEQFFDKYYKGFRAMPYSRKELPQLADSYDRFVVGSDQVWNFDSISVDYTYFLDFVADGNKKISYAASFGQSGVPEREQQNAARLIGDFKAISVREQSGIQAVRDVAGREAEWVLDPSLLRSREQWESMATAPREKEYVFVYLREESARIDAFAKALAKEHGLQIIKVSTHWKCDHNGKRVSAVGPQEWLGYMKNACYIVTNSFHGICFSLALEKEFFVDLLTGGRADTNPRLSSLLNLFELGERHIDKNVDLSNVDAVDYAKVNSIKKVWQEKSLNYLKQALAGGEDGK